MKVIVDGMNVMITCTDHELEILEDGLLLYVASERDTKDNENVSVLKGMLTDIANCDVRP